MYLLKGSACNRLMVITWASMVLLGGLTGCSTEQQTAQLPTYLDPLVEQRADPWIYKDSDDTYYFIGTAPEFDRIELRSAKTINGLQSAQARVIWNKHVSGPMSEHIWAPELHKIDGVWYVYFAASSVEDKWRIAMYALSNTSADPMQGEWQEAGEIQTAWKNFALDATVFEHKGQHYMIWAQADANWSNGTALWLAPMLSATELDLENIIQISEPDYDWEKVTHKVNEGAAVLKRNGKIFVTFSASATDHSYAMGMLWIDDSADILDENAWNKLPEPVLTTNESLERYGPGHNSFTVAEDGKTDLLIYHSRDYLELIGDPLSDPNRHARVKVIEWDDQGFPVFGQDRKF